MLNIEHLKDKTESWLSDLHFTINLRKQSKGRSVVIVQGFLEVEVGQDIYTFIQEAQCDYRDEFIAEVAQLIVAIRMQHSISLWRAAKFRPLKTAHFDRKTVFVIPKADHPFYDNERIEFTIRNVRRVLSRTCQFSFSPYPHQYDNVESQDTIKEALQSYASSRAENFWTLHVRSFLDTILPPSPFNIKDAMLNYGLIAQGYCVNMEFSDDDKCAMVLGRAQAAADLLAIAGRLGVPDQVSNYQLERLDADIKRIRPSSEQYVAHQVVEVDQPTDNTNEFTFAKPIVKDVIEMEDTRRMALTRQGPNDLEVTIYRNHQWIPSYMSDIRKEEFFLVAQTSPYGQLPTDRCFHARDGVRIVPTSDPAKPTFMVQGLEIVTAPATPNTNRQLRSPQHISGIGFDVDDEEPIRNSTPAALLFQTKPATPSN